MVTLDKEVAVTTSTVKGISAANARALEDARVVVNFTSGRAAVVSPASLGERIAVTCGALHAVLVLLWLAV
jgi:hypothetical protein